MPPPPASSTAASATSGSPACCSRASCSIRSRRRSAVCTSAPTPTTPRSCGTYSSTASALADPDRLRAPRRVVAEHPAALHHEAHLLGHRDVRQRIAGYPDDVGEEARLQAPAVVGVDELGGHDSGGADRLDRCHAAVDEGDQLLGVAPVRD